MKFEKIINIFRKINKKILCKIIDHNYILIYINPSCFELTCLRCGKKFNYFSNGYVNKNNQ